MKKIPYFDGHCDSIYRCHENKVDLTEAGGDIDLSRLDGFACYAQIFTFFYSAQRAGGKPMLPLAKAMYELFQRQLELCGQTLVHCRNGEEIRQKAGEGRCCALLSIEGADLLDCEPDNLAYAQQWNVKLINLTWNCANRLSGSHCQAPDRGLSDYGKAFVRQANSVGILMDVSHLSEKGFWDLERITQLPLVASHSNSRTIFEHSRGLTDDQFRAIRDTGGVVGLNYYTDFIGPKPDMEHFVRHMEHFLELGGEKTVALGSDFDGCETLLCGVSGLHDVPKIYRALADRGYSEELLTDIFWKNWLRLM